MWVILLIAVFGLVVHCLIRKFQRDEKARESEFMLDYLTRQERLRSSAFEARKAMIREAILYQYEHENSDLRPHE